MLRRCFLVLIATGLFVSSRATADEVIPKSAGVADAKLGVLWYDIKPLGVEGRGWNDTETFYDRLPSKAKGVVRDPVWGLSKNSAGMSVRFVTDATTIAARWKLRSTSLALPHMPATGVSGVDLYAKLPSGVWHWLAIGKPTAQTNTAVLTSALEPGKREFQLYLPLYNGVESVEIGVPESATLTKAPGWGDRKPIVFYGTSITQGACASRPGMCYSAIVGRWLDRPVINLGFSGNGKMEREVADLLAELDPCVFVINTLPNLSAAEVTERTATLVNIVRKAHPVTPIVLCEDRSYANAVFVKAQRERNDTSRAALRVEYDKLIASGVKNLHFLDGASQLSADGEDTVDSSHPTDLGFMHQAEAMRKVLEPVIGARK